MMEKIDIKDASIAEEIRKNMAVATITDKGLMPANLMKEEARVSMAGSLLMYKNQGTSGATISTSLLISVSAYGGGQMSLLYMTIRRSGGIVTAPSIYLKRICGETVPYNNRFKLLNNDVTGEFSIFMERTIYTPAIYVKILNTIASLIETLPMTLVSQDDIDSAAYITES